MTTGETDSLQIDSDCRLLVSFHIPQSKSTKGRDKDTYLIDPIGIQNPKTSKLASSTLLSNRSQIALELQLCNTLVLGLSINNTLAHRSLSTPSSDTNTVHYIALQNNQPTTTA